MDHSDILNILVSLVEEEAKTPPEASVEPAKADRATALINAVHSRIKSSDIISFKTPFSEIKQQAGIIAQEIEKYRSVNGITSDLTGPDLIDEIAISILRLKVLYAYSVYIYQNVLSIGNLKNTWGKVIWAKLHYPNIKELIAFNSIYEGLPQEYKLVIDSVKRKDILSDLIEQSKTARKDLQDLENGKTTETKLRQRREEEQKRKAEEEAEETENDDEVDETDDDTVLAKVLNPKDVEIAEEPYEEYLKSQVAGRLATLDRHGVTDDALRDEYAYEDTPLSNILSRWEHIKLTQESKIYNILSNFVEGVKTKRTSKAKKEQKKEDTNRPDTSIPVSLQMDVETFERILERNLLSGICKEYSKANKANVDTIDTAIYKYFSEYASVKSTLQKELAKFTGKKNKEVKNPETGKRDLVDDETAPFYNNPGVVSGDSNLSDDKGQGTLFDVTKTPEQGGQSYTDSDSNVPQNTTKEQELQELPTQKVSGGKVSDLNIAADIFKDNNLAIKYFNNRNFTLLIGKLLTIWDTQEQYKIAYVDPNTKALITNAFGKFIRDYSNGDIEDLYLPIPVEYLELMSDSLDILVSIANTKLPITAFTETKLRTIFQSVMPNAFDLLSLEQHQKAELARELKTGITFSIDTVGTAGLELSYKALVLDRIKKALVTETDPTTLTNLRNALTQITNLQDTDAETIKTIASTVLSGNILVRIENLLKGSAEEEAPVQEPVIQQPNPEQEQKIKDIKLTATVLGTLIFDKFSDFDVATKTKTLTFNGKTYTDAKDFISALANMSKEELSGLYNQIQTGSMLTNEFDRVTKQKLAFYDIKGGPAAKNKEKLNINFNRLLTLKESRLVEATEKIEGGPTLALENAYVAHIVKSAGPILQDWDLTVKRVPTFLMNLSVIMRKYAEYKHKPGSEQSLGYGSLSQDEYLAAKALLERLTPGEKASTGTLNSLVIDLRSAIIPEDTVIKLTDLFLEEHSKIEESIFFKPIRAEYIMAHYNLLKVWLYNFFSNRKDIIKILNTVYKKDEAVGSFENLRDFLLLHLQLILHAIKGERYAEKLIREIRAICSGNYEYFTSSSLQQKAQPEEDVLSELAPDVDEEELARREDALGELEF